MNLKDRIAGLYCSLARRGKKIEALRAHIVFLENRIRVSKGMLKELGFSHKGNPMINDLSKDEFLDKVWGAIKRKAPEAAEIAEKRAGGNEGVI